MSPRTLGLLAAIMAVAFVVSLPAVFGHEAADHVDPIRVGPDARQETAGGHDGPDAVAGDDDGGPGGATPQPAAPSPPRPPADDTGSDDLGDDVVGNRSDAGFDD
jgi:hypothetical protein